MAKKAANKSDRSDPKQNKSQAIRNVLGKLPKKAKASEIVEEVEKEYGHTVPLTMVYMVKTKQGMAKSRKRGRKAGRAPTAAQAP